jgi:hypothetical protein
MFRGLYLLIFDSTGCLKDDCDVTAVIFLRQFCYLAKKAALQCPVENVQKEVRAFLDLDQGLPTPEKEWFLPSVSSADLKAMSPGFRASKLYGQRLDALSAPERRMMSVILVNLDKVSGLLSTVLGPYRYQDWRFRHGPGAIAEATGKSNKYRWTNWSNRLDSEYPMSDCGFFNHTSWVDHIQNWEISSKEPFSRLVDVPKSFTKPRLISVEPSEHQWCQQNIWHYLCDRVRAEWPGSFIHFRDQTHNQTLCTKGSKDGSLITVDLSAASDRVTCHAVGQLFARNRGLLCALRATRTMGVKQVLVSDRPERNFLKKFSTMGSACTFPVQSLFFLAISLAAVLYARGKLVTRKNIQELVGSVAVYGDDLIVPADSRDALFSTLAFLDCKINTDKSFWAGRFRESCGVDSFRGVNVTPVYWKQLISDKPESVVSATEVRNHFYLGWYQHVSRHMTTALRKVVKLPYVGMGSGVLGLKTRCKPPLPTHRCRWNGKLQRVDVSVPTLLAKVRKTPIEDDTALFQYLTERPVPDSKWKSGIAQRPVISLRYRWVAWDDMDP